MTAGDFFFLSRDGLRGTASVDHLSNERELAPCCKAICLFQSTATCLLVESEEPGSCGPDDTCEVFEHGDEKRNESKMEKEKQGREETA